MELEREPSIGKSPQKLSFWLEVMVTMVFEEVPTKFKGRPQKRQKKSFDVKLRRRKEKITKEDQLFLRVDQKTGKRRHNLAPTKTGPYQVIESQNHTVFIERKDLTHERISLDRV